MFVLTIIILMTTGEVVEARHADLPTHTQCMVEGYTIGAQLRTEAGVRSVAAYCVPAEEMPA